MADDCKNDEVLSAFYHYLLEEVDDETEFQKTRPITAIYKKLQKVNLSNPIKYLMHLHNNLATFGFVAPLAVRPPAPKPRYC